MTDDEKRERVAEARKAQRAVYLATDEHVAEDLSRIIRGLADALEGTLTGPDTVSTIEELDALPIGSVVMECQAEPFLGIPTVAGVFHKFPLAVQEPGRTSREGWREWYVVAGHGARPASEIQLPAQVLRKVGA